jgi:hypothetical protein
MMQQPSRVTRKMTPPTAMPTSAPRESGPDGGGVYVGTDEFTGVVMFTGVMEKRLPCREMVEPSAGRCSHPASRAVITRRSVRNSEVEHFLYEGIRNGSVGLQFDR